MRGRRTVAALALVITAATTTSATTSTAGAAPLAGAVVSGPVVAGPATPFESLRLGSKGERVRQVQDKLRATGSTIVADGVFGPKTRTAVRKFQRAKSLRADGVVGPVTWKALGLAESPATDTPGIPAGSYKHPYANVERWHDDALAAGWSDSQWPRLSCIMYRESKGIPTAKNPRTPAMGLLQIMWSAHSRWIGGSSSQLYDGPTNLRIGRELYERAGSWQPWISTSSKC